MPADSSDVTQLLREWRAGDASAANRLFEAVLPDLRRLAQHFMKKERADHTLEPTELVDQIYFKLVAAKDRDWQSRGHFFAIAARAMRRYLIDYSRTRPDAELVPMEALTESCGAPRDNMDLAVTIDSLLDRMEAVNHEWCTIVELKFFLGLTDDEAAEVMGIHVRKLQREWFDARRWLFERVQSGSTHGRGASGI